MKRYSESNFAIAIIILVLNTLVSEIIKQLIEDTKISTLVSVAFITIVIIIIVIVQILMKRSINKSPNPQSIAIKSSKFVRDYLKQTKQQIKSQGQVNELDDCVKEIKSISHSLLILGEYKVRIALGKLIAKNTLNDVLKMQMMIDEQGWTLVMSGKRKAISVLKEAMKLSQYQLTGDDLEPMVLPSQNGEEFNKLFLVVRAKRHIGAASFTSFSNRIKELEEALIIIQYLENNKNSANKLPIEKIHAMKTGLLYGLGECYYGKYHEDKDKRRRTQQYEDLLNAFKFVSIAEERSRDYSNQHRHMKCLLLINSIYQEYCNQNIAIDFMKCYPNNPYAIALNNYNSKLTEVNLEKVEKLLNDSLYVDEAFEFFLKQKVKVGATE